MAQNVDGEPLDNLYDIGESNPVPAAGLWSGSGSKVIQFLMSRHPSTRNISSKSIHAFLSNLANRQTGKATQGKHNVSTYRQTNAGNRIYLLRCRRWTLNAALQSHVVFDQPVVAQHCNNCTAIVMSRIRLRRLSTSLLSLFRRSFVESRLTPARSTSTTVEWQNLSIVTSFRLCRSSVQTGDKVDSLSRSTLSPNLNMFNSVDFVESRYCRKSTKSTVSHSTLLSVCTCPQSPGCHHPATALIWRCTSALVTCKECKPTINFKDSLH